MYARSSLPIKFGLMLANSVGIIDADYRGEYFMQLYNFTQNPIQIKKYTRLCQIEFVPHYRGDAKFGTTEIPPIQMKVDDQLFQTFSDKFPSVRGDG